WAFDGTLSFWKFEAGQVVTPAYLWMKAGTPGPFAFNSDGTRMLSGNVGNWARIWEPAKKEVIQELFGHKSTVVSAVYGASDAYIFTGSKDGTIRMWRSATIKDIPLSQNTTHDLPSDSVTSTKDSSAEVAIDVPINDTTTTRKDTTVATIPAAVNPTTLNDSVPVVKMEAGNKPSLIGGREVRQAGTIELNAAEVTIYVFDNSYIDGDTMSLYFNDEWILDHYGVTKSKKPVKLTFNENTNNYLVLFANNLGKTPPNTAAIQFFDGKSERFFRLSSDLNTCSALNFIYRK
ncbi:MAG: WD40 repeat domain-containing protein, partial [Bacteroidota bacterium]